MKRKTLTPRILFNFTIKLFANINQNNFLTSGPAQDVEAKKLMQVIQEFLNEN